MKISNEGMKSKNFHLKKKFNKIAKKREDNSTIETKFDKHGNKASMYETVKEVDEEKITKKKIMSLTSDNTNSLQSCSVEDIGEINSSLIIEAELTKNN